MKTMWPKEIQEVAEALEADLVQNLSAIQIKDAYDWLHRFYDADTKEWTDSDAAELCQEIDALMD